MWSIPLKIRAGAVCLGCFEAHGTKFEVPPSGSCNAVPAGRALCQVQLKSGECTIPSEVAFKALALR